MAKVLQLGDGWWKTDRAAIKKGKSNEPVKKVKKPLRETVFFTPKSLAEKLHVKHETVLSWIRDKLLDAQPLPQGYRIADYAVEEFLERQRNKVS